MLKKILLPVLFYLLNCTFNEVWGQSPRLMISVKHLDSKENEAGVNSVCFSPDGRLVASGARDGVVKIWDVKTGKLIYDLPSSTYSSTALFTSDGKYILSARAGAPGLWELATGKLKFKLNLDKEGDYEVVAGHSGIYFATIGVDSQEDDRVAKIWVWKTSSQKAIDSILAKDIYFLKNDTRIAAVTDSFVVIRDIAKPAFNIKLGSGSDYIFRYSISEERGIALIQYDRGIYETWDLETGKQIQRRQLEIGNPLEQEEYLSAASGKIIVKDSVGLVHFFDITSGREITRLKDTCWKNNSQLFLDENAKMLVYQREGDHNLVIADLLLPATVKIIDHKLPYLNGVDFNADKTLMVYSGWNELGLTRISTGESMLFGQDSYNINHARADSSANTIAISSNSNYIKIWQFQQGGKIDNLSREMKGYDRFFLDIDRPGTYLIANNRGSYAGTHIWDLQTKIKQDLGVGNWQEFGEHISREAFFLQKSNSILINKEGFALKWLKDQQQYYMQDSLIFDPENSSGLKLPVFSIISPEENYATLVGDPFVATDKLVLATLLPEKYSYDSLPFFSNKITGTRFSFDEKWLLVMGKDSSITLWDIPNKKTARVIRITGDIIDACFSPDNKKLLLHTAKKKYQSPDYDQESSLQLYDLTSGKLLRSWNQLGYTPETIQFNKESDRFFSAEEEYFTDVWDIATAKKLTRLTGSLSMDEYDFRSARYLLTATPAFLYIWEPRSLKQVYSFIPVDSAGYLAKLPNGFFMCPADAAKQLHYVTADLNIITFEQLDIKYNRPDKVLEALGSTDTALINSYRKAYQKRIARLGIDTSSFKEGFTVPVADFKNRNAVAFQYDKQQLRLQLKGNAADTLDRFNIWVNEVPVYGRNGISLRAKKIKNIDTTLIIALSNGSNKVEASVIDINGTESYRMPLMVNYTPPVKQKEMTRFIGIGIDKFKDSEYNLQYSVKDIRDLADSLKKRYRDNIIIDTLFNTSVTLSNVKALKQKLRQTTENDKVIIAYSGHGLLSKEYDYYLSTYSVNFDKPEQNGLPYDELENLLDSIPARQKLMLIDACHSGEVDKEDLVRLNASSDSLIKGVTPVAYKQEGRIGLTNSFELMQSLFVNVGKSTGATIISAAAGTQFALERNDLKNGVFTYSILDAMKQYPRMKISQLKKIVSEKVAQLTKGLQQPTSRNETIAVDWDIW